MEPKDRIHQSLKKMLHYNFLGGIAWGLGATIGFAFVITVLTFLLNQIGGIPLVGEWIANIVAATNRSLEARQILR